MIGKRTMAQIISTKLGNQYLQVKECEFLYWNFRI